MKNYFIIISIFFTSLTTIAAELPKFLKISPSGEIHADNLTLRLVHWNTGWHSSHQGAAKVNPTPSYPQRTKEFFKLYGTFEVNGGAFKLKETIQAVSEGTIKYNATLSSAKGVYTAALALTARFPVKRVIDRPILVDGVKINFGQDFSEKKWIYSKKDAQKITIPSTSGAIELNGDFYIWMQDDRKFNNDFWELRIYMMPRTKIVTDASLTFSMHMIHPSHKTIDLRQAVNMGFSDKTANDGKGGWTDQGPENDLSVCPIGKQRLANIDFDIINPDNNDGKSCVVLRGKERPVFPADAVVKPEQPISGKYLYILHALAWEPENETEIGEVFVEYTDNEFVAKSEQVFSLKSGIDVANFWKPRNLKNSLVAWKHENLSSDIGLYITRLNLTGKPVKKITFSSTGKAVWMIAGLTMSDHRIDSSPNEPVTITANKDWLPLNEIPGKVKKGSILDFSGQLDAPAGKYGFARVVKGSIEFEKRPGISARFYGTNIAFSTNFIKKEKAEQMVTDIAAIGYNLVRLHHFDRDLAWRKNGSSTELNPKLLDRLDYLVAVLKQRGIYITFDLFMLRHLEKGEIPEFPNREIQYSEFKALAFINDNAMKNFQEFAANLLNHVNPYTGIAWKNDPAIITVSMINEDSLFATSVRVNFLHKLFLKNFDNWLDNQNIKDTPTTHDWLWKRFLSETYLKGYTRIQTFMKKLGVKALYTDQNHWNTLAATILRENFDIVDNHFYWGHPSFLGKNWQLPASVDNKSSISRYAGELAGMFPTRIIGKPFSITEWDYVNPNEYNVEGAFLTGAYASLQDWSILCRFAYSHDRRSVLNTVMPIGFFSCSGDPLRLLSERAGILFFLRKDVASSKAVFPYLLNRKHFSKNNAFNNFPMLLFRIGLIGKTGTLLYTPEEEISFPTGTRVALLTGKTYIKNNGSITILPVSDTQATLKKLQNVGKIKKSEFDPDKNRFTSSTGELTLDRNAGNFKVMTLMSEGFVMKANSTLKGRFASVCNEKTFAAFLVTSCDGKTLSTSKRILILHLTDAKNSNMKFRDSELRIIEEWGTLPILIHRGKAKISINSPMTNYHLFAIGMDGTRLNKVPLNRNTKQCHFEIDTNQNGNVVAAYELVKQK